MNVLGLDSATDACSAAVLRDGEVVARRFEIMRRGHAETLMLLVRDVVRRAETGFDALDLIATTVGPGGFTGLRIGLASARALARAARLPIIGVTTLEAVARAQPPGATPFLIALDAKRADIYVQLFDSDRRPLGEPAALPPPEIAALVPTGDLAVGGNASAAVLRALADRLPPLRKLTGPDLPDAAVVAAIGAARFAAQSGSDLPPPRPLYLRAPDARLPGARNR